MFSITLTQFDADVQASVSSQTSDLSDEDSSLDTSGNSDDSKTTNTPNGLRRRSISSSGKTGLAALQNDLTVHRPILTVTQKHQQYRYSKPIKRGFRKAVKDKVRTQARCSTKGMKQAIFLRLPIIEWLLHYDVKTNLVGDIIAGTTIAIMNIPQGMAYAMLAGLDPISGIYMAFFPVLVYAFFASSRHCSVGTFAVICLMTGKLVADYATYPDEVPEEGVDAASTVINGTITYSPAEVATIVSFGVSVWMIIFGFFHIGSLSVFLSDMLISGFTTGAAVQVLTSQIKSLFGVTIATYNGPFNVIKTWVAILKEILDSNPATMVISMVCIVVLEFNNQVLKPRLRKVTRIPFPVELVVVVCGTMASKYGELNAKYDVTVVGDIPTGLPPPALPPFELLGKVMGPCLTITIVSFCISYSVGKVFAKKLDYTVDATQELFALGLGNFVGSFFQCGPISASLSRSLIQVSVGGVTQLTSYISCSLIVLVLLFIGPFFEPLPNCVLAAVIVTALKGMFYQVHDFTAMWKISKIEASIWMISFLGVVIIDVDYGLFIGIGCSLLLLIIRSQIPNVTVLGRVPHTDIYLDKDRYASVIEVSGVKMCHVAASLHFANQESFRNSLILASQINPEVIVRMERKEKKKARKLQKQMQQQSSSEAYLTTKRNSIVNDFVASVEATAAKISEAGRSADHDHPTDEDDSVSTAEIKIKAVGDVEVNILEMILPETKSLIVDFSGVGKIDVAAATNLSLIYKEYTEAHISIYYSSLSEHCLEVMEKSGALADIPDDAFFHSVHDAVSYITTKSSPEERTPNVVHHL